MLLIRRTLATGLFAVSVAPLFSSACGAKSGLRDAPIDAGPDTGIDVWVGPDCVDAEDCFTGDLCQQHRCVEGRCMPPEPKTCDDGDECTEDVCVPETGECESRELALDQDGDGFKGPRPGFAPGAPGACGDDCDDTSAKAFPGNPEVCDGVDNDCDGIVDNDAHYVPAGPDVVRVSAQDLLQAGHGGLAWNGKLYAAAYTGQKSAWRTYVKGLNADGTTAFGDEPITNVPSDTFTGPVVWTGAIFGTAWEDRRDNDYEIYFNRFDADGKKLSEDLRVTAAPGFSLHASMIWNGAEFVVVWDDRRNGPADYRAYGQRIDVNGKMVGNNVELTEKFWNAESPAIAEGEKTVAITFNMGDALFKKIGFRAFAPDLTGGGPLVTISDDNGVNPSIVWNKDRYIVVYGKRTSVPGDAIWGAVIAEDGKILVPEKKITSGAKFARTQAILPLGDRLLFVWADDHDGNYELYSKMLSPSLTDLTARERITNHPSDTVAPSIAFGPDGDVGVLFDDRRSGAWQVYFSRLVCQAGG